MPAAARNAPSDQPVFILYHYVSGETSASRPQILRKAVYFERHNEVVVGQPAKRIRRESYRHIVVRHEVKIRVMSLVLRQHGHALQEGGAALEILQARVRRSAPEYERASNQAGV